MTEAAHEEFNVVQSFADGTSEPRRGRGGMPNGAHANSWKGTAMIDRKFIADVLEGDPKVAFEARCMSNYAGKELRTWREFGPR